MTADGQQFVLCVPGHWPGVSEPKVEVSREEGREVKKDEMPVNPIQRDLFLKASAKQRLYCFSCPSTLQSLLGTCLV